MAIAKAPVNERPAQMLEPLSGVRFAGESESLTLSHSAIDRGLFARGAIAAAVWVRGKPPGLYDMQDVLGLK